MHSRTKVPKVTARPTRMLDLAHGVGMDLDDLELARRRLAVHEHEHDRTPVASRRAELVRLMAADISVLAAAYRKLEAAVDGRSQQT